MAVTFLLYILVISCGFQVHSESYRSEDCSKYDFYAEGCRNYASGCSFSCSDMLCVNEGYVKCSDKCTEYCFDPCGCKKAACEYNFVENTCHERIRKCGRLDFEIPTCLQNDTFYLYKGTVCHSKDSDICPVNTIVAINFNAQSGYTDSNGITYTGDTFYDENIFQFGWYNKKVGGHIYGVDPQDESLFLTYATTNDCFGINYNLWEKGHYEAVIKTAEFEFWNRFDRAFEINLGDVLVLPLFDILSYVSPMHGLTFAIKFELIEVEDDWGNLVYALFIEGYEPFNIYGAFVFQVCEPMICRDADSKASPISVRAVISAMYFNKLDDLSD